MGMRASPQTFPGSLAVPVEGLVGQFLKFHEIHRYLVGLDIPTMICDHIYWFIDPLKCVFMSFMYGVISATDSS